MSTLAHTTPCRPWRELFCFESRSKTGSIIRHGGHVWLVKKATVARWDRRKESNDAELVMMCTDEVIDEGVANGCEVIDVAAGVRAWAWSDMREAPSWLSGNLAAAGAWPSTGRLNIASMVGRNAAPRGVDKKSLGRSVYSLAEDPRKPRKDGCTFDELWYGATR